jgi:DnaJ domain
MRKMPRMKRTDDWGWPRWRGYGSNSAAQTVKLCDRHGCTNPGNHPAPKSPNSPERWYFCADHAAEYNRNWDYFAGLSAEDAAARAADEAAGARSYARAQHYAWSGPGDGSRSGDEMRALDVLGLDPDADFESIKKAWRALAKETHPDVKPGDADAAKRFQAGQVSFEILRQAEERKSWKPA